MRIAPALFVASALCPSLLAQSWTGDVLSPKGMIERHVTHDFNGDGAQDVLAIGPALSTTGSLAAFLYLGNGDGTFLRRGKVQRGIRMPDRILAGDVTGDGHADALILDMATGSVRLLGGDGAGQFSAPSAIASIGGSGSTAPGSLRCVDGDGDGDLDVFFSARNAGISDGVYWVEQLGMDALAPAVALSPQAYPVFSFDAADLDGDGDMDLVAAAGQGGLVWFRNDGSAPFSGPFLIEAGLNAGKARDVRAFDVDQDGLPDLVGTIDANSVRMGFYRNLGGGTFAPAVAIADMTDAVAATVFGDLDGDGIDDIAVEQFERRCEGILVGAGATFSQRFPIVSPTSDIGGFDLADMDGDGRVDGVFSGRLLYNIGGGSRVPVMNYSRNTGFNGSVVTFDQNQRIETFSYSATSYGVADYTGDGAPDLAVGSHNPHSLVVYENGGDTSFARTTKLPSGAGLVRQIVSLDVDGDADIDMVYSFQSQNSFDVFLARNGGDGRTWTATQYPAFSVMGAGDVEGDGDEDVFVLVRQPPNFNFAVAVAENVPAGALAAPRALVAFPDFTFVRAGLFDDLDGDGDADIIVGRIEASTHVLDFYRAEPGGAYSGPFQLDTATYATSPHPSKGFTKFVARDFNGDGLLDVAALGLAVTGGGLRIYFQSANGFSAPLVLAPTPASGATVGLEAEDLDGDGDADLMLTMYRAMDVPGELHIYENTLTGTFSAPTVVPLIGSDPSTFVTADIDLDGDVDFVTASAGIDTDEHFALHLNDQFRSLGGAYCVSAVPNSTGSPGHIAVTGSSLVQDNVARLRSWGLPTGTLGFFLTSQTPGEVLSVPNSVGILCLGGQIGRFSLPSQIQNTGTTGTMSLDVNLQALPDPALGTVSVLAGQPWHFQGWTRDVVGGMVTSNFTEAATVTWQ